MPPEPAPSLAPPSVKQILFGSGPRFARDAFGPVLAFYVGWKLSGLVLGMALAVIASLAAYAYERRQDRSGVMAQVALGLIALQVVVGVLADDARAFLAPPVLANGAWGLVFLGSAAIGRPMAGVFAGEMYDFPDEVRSSATFRRVFSQISLVWGLYLVGRSGLRLWALSETGVDGFVVSNLVTGVPLITLLMSWSIWYGVRGFRRSQEWGWAFEPPPAEAPAAPPAPAT